VKQGVQFWTHFDENYVYSGDEMTRRRSEIDRRNTLRKERRECMDLFHYSMDQIDRFVGYSVRRVMMAISFGHFYAYTPLKEDPTFLDSFDHFIGILPAFGLSQQFIDDGRAQMSPYLRYLYDVYVSRRVNVPMVETAEAAKKCAIPQSWIVAGRDEIVDIDRVFSTYREIQPDNDMKRMVLFRDTGHRDFLDPDHPPRQFFIRWLQRTILGLPAPQRRPDGIVEIRGEVDEQFNLESVFPDLAQWRRDAQEAEKTKGEKPPEPGPAPLPPSYRNEEPVDPKSD